jgi:hypothetical protein
MRDRLQVRVEHGALRIECLTVTIAISGGVEEPSEFILSVWSKSLLVLEKYDAVFVKGTSDDFKIRLCTSVRWYPLTSMGVGKNLLVMFSRSAPRISAPKSIAEPFGGSIL